MAVRVWESYEEPTLYIDQSEDHNEDPPMMRFGERHIHVWLVYVFLGMLVAVFSILANYLGVYYQDTSQLPEFSVAKLKEPVLVSERTLETDNLISQLKYYGLWELSGSEKVPRFFIKAYPSDLNFVGDISIKKRVFLHSLLPHAIFVRQETLYKRNKLKLILSKIDCSDENLKFISGPEYGGQCFWTDFLDEEEVNFIQSLGKEFRTTSAEILLERVDAVPTSIILAQGALESSWGSSRFTREGNSIFGIWTWKTAGIVPAQRDEGKTHKVKIYENVLESVRSYHLTLNRVGSYEEFRKLRLNTDNPLILAEGLKPYSERGQDYVEDIKSVILSNSLQRYDGLILNDLDLKESFDPFSGTYNLIEPGRASL